MSLPLLPKVPEITGMSSDMKPIYDVPVPFPGVAVIPQLMGHITAGEAEQAMAAQKVAFDIDMDLSNFVVATWYDVGYIVDPRDGIITYHQEVLPWNKPASLVATPGAGPIDQSNQNGVVYTPRDPSW